MKMANPPVNKKLDVQERCSSSSRILQRTDAMILPTFALIAHIPIRIPLLPLPNQLPATAMTPGHPVLWKKPLKHITTTTNA